MHAFRYALSLVSLVFEEVFFAGSASLHDWFLHFLESVYIQTLAEIRCRISSAITIIYPVTIIAICYDS